MSLRKANRRARRRHLAQQKETGSALRRITRLRLRDHTWQDIVLPVLISYLRVRRRSEPTGVYGFISKNQRRRSLDRLPGETSICWDGPNGLMLTCDGRVVACIAYAIDLSGTNVSIVQIQGRRKSEVELRAFPWDQMLIEAVITLAKDAGVSVVSLQPASLNRWRYRGRDTSFLRLYDANARALGFSEPSKWNGMFQMAL
jgi:hypothetical protein